MKNLTAFIGWLLVAVAACLYIFGIYSAIFQPVPNLDVTGKLIGYRIAEPFDTLTSSISAILLTNLGAVLGISITQPQSALANKTLITTNSLTVPPPLTKKDVIQLAAIVIYILALTACFIAWTVLVLQKSGAAIKPLVPLVEQHGKTLIGVISAYAAFLLAKP
jgi:hypothetical protein